ncbi:MAG: MarC family protein, partial [Parachlamydiales bacterium]
FFYFIGPTFLNFLSLKLYTVQISGGIILFLLALKMIFPFPEQHDPDLEKIKEPLIVPIAVPLIAGPAALAMVILYSEQIVWTSMLSAISLAWFCSLLILLGGPFLNRLLKTKGLIALQRLMGLILILIAVQMFLNGIALFLN